jgi:RNA polymerase sigma factor (TIGR02999 family)
MQSVTELLCRIEAGDSAASDQFWPVVYDELRRIAAQQCALEQPGTHAQATALVHEAYLRLTGTLGDTAKFADRTQFFAAAANVMRCVLIDQARRRHAKKRGGSAQRRPLQDIMAVHECDPELLLGLDESLRQLAEKDALAAQLAELRVFGGLSIPEAASTLGIARSRAYRLWTYARAWLIADIT